jgi:hypothetical protein
MSPSPRLNPEASWRTATKTNPCPVPQKQQQIRRRTRLPSVAGANFQVVVLAPSGLSTSPPASPAFPASPQREFVLRVWFPRIARLQGEEEPSLSPDSPPPTATGVAPRPRAFRFSLFIRPSGPQRLSARPVSRSSGPPPSLRRSIRCSPPPPVPDFQQSDFCRKAAGTRPFHATGRPQRGSARDRTKRGERITEPGP